MKKIVFLSIFVSTICLAQNYRKGYFVSTSNQKTECFLPVELVNGLGENLNYKLNSESSETMSIPMKQVKDIVVSNLITLNKFTVKVDLSSNNINELDENRNLTLQERTVFLELIQEGKLKLYTYNPGEYKRFYYFKEGMENPELLDYKKYISGASNQLISINETYKQELINVMADANITDDDVYPLSYTEESLESFFEKYNRKFNSFKNEDRTEKKKLRSILFAFRPKVALSSTNVDYDYTNAFDVYTKTKFGPIIVPEFGLEGEFIFPKQYGLSLSAMYSSYSSSEVQVSTVASATNRNSSIEVKSMKVAIGGRKYFMINSKTDFFAGFKLISDFVLNKSDVQNVYPPVTLVSKATYGIGVGVLFYKRYALELNYEGTRNLATGYANTDFKVNAINLTLSFDLLKK